MPQMAPLLWLYLYFFFLMSLMLILILNFLLNHLKLCLLFHLHNSLPSTLENYS